MGHVVTQNDINILHQGKQEMRIKVELMDSDFKTLDSLEGVIISDSFSQDSESIQRRTYTCNMSILDSTFIIGNDKKIWIDKRLKVYYGIRSQRSKEIVWYKLGIFCYVTMKYSYSKNQKLLSLSCADMMAQYDGTLNGQLTGYGSANNSSNYTIQSLSIPAGEDIRTSIIGILNLAGIKNYVVEDIGKEIPYDLTFPTGSTFASIWTKIRDLYDSWEFYFDEDGVFIWRKVPTYLEDNVVLNDQILNGLVISEETSSSFSGIYNVTEVWGKVLELENRDRYSSTSTYSNNTYRVDFSQYNSWDDVDNLTRLAYKVSSTNADSPSFSINGYTAIPIVDGDGNALKANVLEVDKIYVFRYRRSVSGNSLYLLGNFQCYGRYEETSEDCPFSTTKLGYEILKSIEYESLSDDAACYNQAEYLTYQTTAMMDTITLTMVVIPWLEVNKKIEYSPKYNNLKNQYIVKNLSWNSGDGTMTVTLFKFLESFSFVYNRKYGN
ncbi:DUF5048 domain-containing protein [Clostridium sp. HBUAS56010]|uniref:DUF5048 domain-containing protein n=1 Tax=Clostridium sp. HBUAS56010 TaxID=2571127 RepID=UPI001178A3D5|nr:DUF5048 domain-containing protein [Clostridium sp. HBUAS56010]